MAKTHHILLGSALLAAAQFAFAQTAAEAIGGGEPVAPEAPYTSGGLSDQTTGSSGSSDSSANSPPDTVTVISGPFTVESTDPFVQRREALAQARDEYRARQRAARQEYEQDRREANTEFRESVR